MTSFVWKFSSYFYTNGLYALEASKKVGEVCFHVKRCIGMELDGMTLTPLP